MPALGLSGEELHGAGELGAVPVLLPLLTVSPSFPSLQGCSASESSSLSGAALGTGWVVGGRVCMGGEGGQGEAGAV